MEYNPRNWYWFVAGDTTQVFSSATYSYVVVANATYVAWLAAGGVTTSIASEAELFDVLALAEVPFSIEKTVSTSTFNPTTSGPWTLEIVAGKFFPIGGTLLLKPTTDDSIAVIGEVKAYSSTNLTVSLRATNATVSTSYDSWSIALLDSPPASLPFRSIVGLRVTQNASDTHKIDIAAGSVMDSTGSVLLTLDAALSKDLDVDFSAGNNGGAVVRVLLAGTISNSGTATTGSGTSFNSTFAGATMADYVARGGGTSFQGGLLINTPMISAAAAGARVNGVTNNTSLSLLETFAASSAAHYRGCQLEDAATRWTGYVVVIRKDTDGSVDVCVTSSTPSGAPDLPSGYSTYAVIAAYTILVATPSTYEINQPAYLNNYPFAVNDAPFVLSSQFSSAPLPNAKRLFDSTSNTISVGGSTVEVQRAALTGDVTASANSNSTTIANGAVTFAKIATGTVRELLAADRTYYVRTDGSDSNTGLANSSGGAFLTLQKAINTVLALDLSIYNVTIQVGAGTYTAGVSLSAPFVGSGTVTLLGDTTTPSNVVISTTSASCIFITNYAVLSVGGFKLTTTTAGSGISASAGAVVNITGNMDYGAVPTGSAAHLSSQRGSVISISANYSITGTARFHWSTIAGTIACNSRTITITGTPAFAAFFSYCERLGFQEVFSNTFSGSATGPRYSVSSGGVIFTNGAGTTYLPGNSAGTGTNFGASPYGLYN